MCVTEIAALEKGGAFVGELHLVLRFSLQLPTSAYRFAWKAVVLGRAGRHTYVFCTDSRPSGDTGW